MQAGQCGIQIGTEILKVLCDESGIGGDGEYCGDNDSKLDRINVPSTRPRAASKYHARCSSTLSPA
jgi:hypothetical protein